MKKKVVLLAAILFAGTISSTALAQYVPGCNSGMTQNELTNFNGFLHRHPRDAQKLAANPGLANNPRFLANHPAMKEFLANHPGVLHGLHASPGQFMNSAGNYQWMSPCGGWATAPVAGPPLVTRWHDHDEWREDHAALSFANTDRYLARHPEIAAQLEKHPGLVDNPGYVAGHPGLHGFLATHPYVRRKWKSHPRRFMHREQRYSQNH